MPENTPTLLEEAMIAITTYDHTHLASLIAQDDTYINQTPESYEGGGMMDGCGLLDVAINQAILTRDVEKQNNLANIIITLIESGAKISGDTQVALPTLVKQANLKAVLQKVQKMGENGLNAFEMLEKMCPALLTKITRQGAQHGLHSNAAPVITAAITATAEEQEMLQKILNGEGPAADNISSRRPRGA